MLPILPYICGKHPKKPFKEFLVALTDWVDFDIAQYELGLVLGIFPPGSSFQTDLKGIFWSSNSTGDALHTGIVMLGYLGILEYNDAQWRAAR